ncbi:hypothetical protein MIMGU_mgv11b020273mg, partial [Erythranthe guttata]
PSKYTVLQLHFIITRRFLEMKTQWGFSKFISKKVMSEESNGYIVDDTCVFGPEVFVVKKEATFTVYI